MSAMDEGLAVRRSPLWMRRLASYHRRAERPRPLVVEGRLTRMVGLTLEAQGCLAAIGDRCQIVQSGNAVVETEVVGFAGDRLFLMPIGEVRGLTPHARVIPVGRSARVAVGESILGRVLDGSGKPIDGKGDLNTVEYIPLVSGPTNPLRRRPIDTPLDVGVRAINAFLTVGQGQRLGLFAGSGVGKSLLLGMMTRYTDADVIVVALIGERGREVNEFIFNTLGEMGMRRAVVVVAPADDPPLLRLHGALVATSIAEYFRDQGRRVLLLMDSLTRFAQACREIALAIGEPPATRGYPPSVFARLPKLVERAGNGDERGGGITAFYTVLTEADDPNDPIADAARAILDGHIVLSRELAAQGHYPAIDVETSISRAMSAVTSDTHRAQVRHFRELYALYRQHADLVNMGAYVVGSDSKIDAALEIYPHLMAFLRQDLEKPVSLVESLTALADLAPTNLAQAPPAADGSGNQ
ncbi:MAG: flagellar protein export ATPase FliI [Gammaproteobacteria bacterium]